MHWVVGRRNYCPLNHLSVVHLEVGHDYKKLRDPLVCLLYHHEDLHGLDNLQSYDDDWVRMRN